MPVVWMYRHPSHMWTYKQYTVAATEELENAYQFYLAGGPTFLVLRVRTDPEEVKVVVSFNSMSQHSAVNSISRQVRRFMEDTAPNPAVPRPYNDTA